MIYVNEKHSKNLEILDIYGFNYLGNLIKIQINIVYLFYIFNKLEPNIRDKGDKLL